MTTDTESGKRWLKADLHTHCSLDPIDYRMIEHTPHQLILQAAELGYEVLAITCHNRDIWTRSLSNYAQNLGITLIPGMEVTAERTRHVLAYNFHTGAENLNTLDKIRQRRTEDTLVIAPHPFFPGSLCLRGFLEQNPDVFDAIEYSGFQVQGLNFNRRAVDFARKHGKPLLGLGDIHSLWQLGRTYTWIYAEPEASSIIHAVKQGLVRFEASPLAWPEAAHWWATALWRMAMPVNPVPAQPNLGTLSPARE